MINVTEARERTKIGKAKADLERLSVIEPYIKEMLKVAETAIEVAADRGDNEITIEMKDISYSPIYNPTKMELCEMLATVLKNDYGFRIYIPSAARKIKIIW